MARQEMVDRYSQRLERSYGNVNRRTRGWLAVFARAWMRFNQNRAGESAAGIAFFSIFSFIPMLIFIISIASSFITSNVVLQGIATFLTDAFPVSLGGLMKVINNLLGSSTSLNLVAALVLLWAASNMFFFLLVGVDRSWSVRRQRGTVWNRLLAMAMVTLLAVVVVVLIIVLLLAGLITDVVFHIGIGVPVAVPALFMQAILIVLLYKFGPATAVDTKAVVYSAGVAMLSLEIANRGFTWYLGSRWSAYNTLYGPLGALIGMLFWVYVSFSILLFGSYLAEAIHARWASEDPSAFYEPMKLAGT